MTQTDFTDNVVIDGSRDIEQLTVQGHTTQTQPLQAWRDSTNQLLVQITGDGRTQVGDDLGMATPDALVEAHRDESSSKPKRGFHSLGRISGTLNEVIAWAVQELELLGTGGISALHSALRAKLTNQNTGTMSSGADLRAASLEAVNDGGSSGSPVPHMSGTHIAVTNNANRHLTNGYGVQISISNEGAMANAYGVKVAVNDTQPISNLYAFHADKGVTHLGDPLELKLQTAEPASDPPAEYIKVYPKLDNGTPKLYGKSAGEDEVVLGGGGGGIWVELQARTLVDDVSGGLAAIDFTSIPADCAHLCLLVELRSNRAFTIDEAKIKINGDNTAGNYYSLGSEFRQNNVIDTVENVGASAYLRTGTSSTPAANSPSGYFGMMEIYIFNYATTDHPRQVSWRYVAQRNDSSPAIRIGIGGGTWKGSGAISAISIAPLTGTQWVNGSIFTLYGIK